ncbi:MAG TPA: PilT/PilU family type 4a pilus ATPase [Acidobacteriota bacterium]|nr:PilT/PilU family type 4a pilus ATPase [Acidobacteriota bacterium]
MIDLKALLRCAVDRKASDLHLKVGSLPHIRVQGELMPLAGSTPIKREDTAELAQQLLSTRQKDILSQRAEVDLAFGAAGLGRFRVAVFQQRGSISFVFRLIPDVIPHIEELNLPPVLKKIAEEDRGLVLITGTTGSGKSTTLAAMIDYINSIRRCHILTIEDPIEFLFRDKLAFITQREVSIDTEGFGPALRSALRQDPDVILVGEMRDLETMKTALHAAETGHLVLSTVHTTDTVETVNRVIAMFPPHEQYEFRLMLASAIRAIVSMRLMRSSLPVGRVPAVEVLRNTDFVRSLLEQPEKLKDIRKALEAGTSQYGMQTFDQSILSLYQQGFISLTDALRNASQPEDLKLKLQGIVGAKETV